MTPLNRKLGRDLLSMKGQVAAISLVVAMGVAILVMMTGIVTSLEETRRAYYERYRMANVFAPAVRAPDALQKTLATVPGVSAVQTRVTGSALIDMPNEAIPIRAEIVSLPDYGPPLLNDIYLTAGRKLNSEHPYEVLLLTSFANAHGIVPGESLAVTMNGAYREYRVVGLAQSPEYLYVTAPGELMADDSRYAVMWMSHSALSAAYDMKGAFNSALLSVDQEQDIPAVLEQVDRILSPYGGLGSFDLDDLFSNRVVNDEIDGLRTSSAFVPPVFLMVAAFLLYIVISRLVQAEREKIGLIKAFGYTDAEVAMHYLKFVVFVAASGALLGCLLGVMAGRSLLVVYLEYIKFPFLVFQMEPSAFVSGILVSVLAASAGGFWVLKEVFVLAPAVAMRSPAPADFSRASGWVTFLSRFLDQPSRMVLRNLVRQPGRMLGAVLGVAAGLGLSMAVVSVLVSFERTINLSFDVVDRSDVMVTFIEPISDKTILEMQRLEGVFVVEPTRSVSAVLRNGVESYRSAITGINSLPQLYRAVNADMTTLEVRGKGLVLGKPLAEILNVQVGDLLTIDVREGRQPLLTVQVTGITESLLGSPIYMQLDALNRLLKEPRRVTGAYLKIDAVHRDAVYQKLKDMPQVAGVSLKSDARGALQHQMDSGAGAMRYVMMLIAGVITFGIMYNAARIAYAERIRDLVSLRVIGLTKSDTAFVLLAELAIVTLVALPLGALMGYGLSFAVSEGFSTELYQIPPIFSPSSLGASVLVVIVAAVASGWLVKRDVEKVELVSALKTRE